MLKLRAEELIEPELEAFYLHHRKLKYWTIVHTHDFFECFLVTEGKVRHLVNGVEQVLEAGALVFVRPDDVHSYERFEGEEAELLNVNFRSSLIERAFAYLGDGFDNGRLLRSALPPARGLSPEHAARLVREYERIHQLGAQNRKAEIRALTRAFLIELLNRHFGPERLPDHPEAPRWLNELLDRMTERDNLIGGISAFYEMAPFSMEHVCREMKRHVGMTPTEWLNGQRLEQAAYLLRHSEAGIIEISLDCGFNSLSYFYKMFADRFASTPAHYRKNNRKTAIPAVP